MPQWALALIDIRNLPHDLTVTLRFDHGRQIQATKQVCDLNYEWTRCLIFTFSVPQGGLPSARRMVRFGLSEFITDPTGTSGTGKTPVVPTVPSDHQTKKQFDDNQSSIRRDELTTLRTQPLETTGASSEDLHALYRLLYSETSGLNSAESILGPPEANTRQEIYPSPDEPSQFSYTGHPGIRLSDPLPETPVIPISSIEAVHGPFYRFSRLDEQSDEINEILKELDFPSLSITLLTAVAQQNRWSKERLMTEWEKQRTGVLQARNLGILAATVELSLASPTFQELGADARELLGVIAFFPQGVSEYNVEGLFPTISDGPSMFYTFRNLSLTYHTNGFITMLEPLRDYLLPKDPMASPLLLMAKEHYFRRLSIKLQPGEPGFDKSRWIKSEDVNVEHLLDVFTSMDTNLEDVWDAFCCFMEHLYWNKPRHVVLGPKVEALPDSHPFKPDCLASLSWLLGGVGNWPGQKRMLVQSLGLWGERENDYWFADILIDLSEANRVLGLYEEGIQQAREALENFGRFGETGKQTRCLIVLASLLSKDKQLDAAKEAVSRAMHLPGNRDQLELHQCRKVLGEIHQSQGSTERAVHHFEESLKIASDLNSHRLLSDSHVALAELYLEEGEFDHARTHAEHAKSHAGDDMYLLGRAVFTNACILNEQIGFEDSKAEALRALAIFEELGATDLVEATRQFLEGSGKSIYDGTPLKSVILVVFIHPSHSDTDTESE